MLCFFFKTVFSVTKPMQGGLNNVSDLVRQGSSKLEKAEILEMTVRHLTDLQGQKKDGDGGSACMPIECVGILLCLVSRHRRFVYREHHVCSLSLPITVINCLQLFAFFPIFLLLYLVWYLCRILSCLCIFKLLIVLQYWEW